MKLKKQLFFSLLKNQNNNNVKLQVHNAYRNFYPDLKKNCGVAVNCHASLAAMHPALRQTAAGLAALTPQSIQSQAAAAAAALCGIPPGSMAAALAMRNSTAVSNTGQLLTTSPYLTAAANPLVRKLIPAGQGPKLYGSNEEMLLDTTGLVSQPDLGHGER